LLDTGALAVAVVAGMAAGDAEVGDGGLAAGGLAAGDELVGYLEGAVAGDGEPDPSVGATAA
jgi:hypothetical protein